MSLEVWLEVREVTRCILGDLFEVGSQLNSR